MNYAIRPTTKPMGECHGDEGTPMPVTYTDEDLYIASEEVVAEYKQELVDQLDSVHMIGSEEWKDEMTRLFLNMQDAAKEKAQDAAEWRQV